MVVSVKRITHRNEQFLASSQPRRGRTSHVATRSREGTSILSIHIREARLVKQSGGGLVYLCEPSSCWIVAVVFPIRMFDGNSHATTSTGHRRTLRTSIEKKYRLSDRSGC